MAIMNILKNVFKASQFEILGRNGFDLEIYLKQKIYEDAIERGVFFK